MAWKVPKIWDGGTCVILGGGPSLLQQFDVPEEIIKDVYSGKLKPSAYSPYLKPLHTMHVIGVNVAYRMGPWVDVMFFGDESTWSEEKTELIKFKGLRVTCCPGLHLDRRLKYLIRNPRHRMGISTDPTMVSWNSNSGSAAINFAVHTGVKRIILLGFDMSLDTDKNQHWHKFYSSNVNLVEQTFQKHMRGFSEMKKELDLLGVEVINASPVSRITVFPKMNFKDIKL